MVGEGVESFAPIATAIGTGTRTGTGNGTAAVTVTLPVTEVTTLPTTTTTVATVTGPPPLPPRIGPCALGSACTATNQELSDQYRCRLCNKQLHGFISGCSQARNPKDFRDGVICKEQPCFDGEVVPVLKEPGRADGAVSSHALNTYCLYFILFLNLEGERDPSH